MCSSLFILNQRIILQLLRIYYTVLTAFPYIINSKVKLFSCIVPFPMQLINRTSYQTNRWIKFFLSYLIFLFSYLYLLCLLALASIFFTCTFYCKCKKYPFKHTSRLVFFFNLEL